MANPQGGKTSQHIDLTMRFDPSNPNPDRFDPAKPAPTRPIEDHLTVAGLFRQGNLNYAGFIRDCREAAGKKIRPLAEKLPSGSHVLHLNEFEVARDACGAGTKKQNPYSAVVSCIDSRVPMELVLGQAADDAFAIRTAGNILTQLGEANASMHYVLGHYAKGVEDSEATIPAMLVLGHTRCGAIHAAYEAFRPCGGGTINMPASLAALLYQMKPAVDYVLEHRKALGLKSDDEIEDAISVFNACFSRQQIQQMAIDAGVSDDFKVYFAVYDVEDFYFEVTDIPDYPNQQCQSVCASIKKSRKYSWTDNAPVLESDEMDALGADAARFAKRNR